MITVHITKRGDKTVNCKALRSYLEHLVHKGLLQQYILNPEVTRSPDPEKKTPDLQDTGRDSVPSYSDVYKTVFVVFSATTVEGLAARARRIYVNQTKEVTPLEVHNSFSSSTYRANHI